LLGYLEQITAELPLPVFLYNLPSHTKLSFEPETVRRLIEIPNVVGLKDSSADMIYFHKIRRLCERRPDWSLLIGPEELLAEAVLLGAHGGVSGGANLCPRLYVELYQAAARGDTARVAELHVKVIEISQTIYRVADHAAAVIAGLKCALSCLAICNDLMAEPFRRPRDAERQLIRKHLAELELPLGAPRTPGPSPTPG